MKNSEKRLKNSEEAIEKAKNWEPNDFNKYNNRNPKDILVKKIIVKFSYQHPIYNTRAESNQIIITNIEGTKVLNN